MSLQPGTSINFVYVRKIWCILYEATYVVIVVLTLTHRYNAVGGHRTGSNNSGAEDYLTRKSNEKLKIIHTITETNRVSQTKIKRWDQRTYVRALISPLYFCLFQLVMVYNIFCFLFLFSSGGNLPLQSYCWYLVPEVRYTLTTISAHTTSCDAIHTTKGLSTVCVDPDRRWQLTTGMQTNVMTILIIYYCPKEP